MTSAKTKTGNNGLTLFSACRSLAETWILCCEILIFPIEEVHDSVISWAVSWQLHHRLPRSEANFNVAPGPGPDHHSASQGLDCHQELCSIVCLVLCRWCAESQSKARLAVIASDHAVGRPSCRHSPPASMAGNPKIAHSSCTPAASTALCLARPCGGRSALRGPLRLAAEMAPSIPALFCATNHSIKWLREHRSRCSSTPQRFQWKASTVFFQDR